MTEIRYQIRIKENMADYPADNVPTMFSDYSEAYTHLMEIRKDICATWATPDPMAAYIQKYEYECDGNCDTCGYARQAPTSYVYEEPKTYCRMEGLR